MKMSLEEVKIKIAIWSPNINVFSDIANCFWKGVDVSPKNSEMKSSPLLMPLTLYFLFTDSAVSFDFGKII